jgi:hypothetical protein
MHHHLHGSVRKKGSSVLEVAVGYLIFELPKVLYKGVDTAPTVDYFVI